MSRLPLESHYNISACLRLGSQFVNHQCRETIEPQWIRTDIGQHTQMGNLDNKFGIHKFKIIRNGVHFHFGKFYGELGETASKIGN